MVSSLRDTICSIIKQECCVESHVVGRRKVATAESIFTTTCYSLGAVGGAMTALDMLKLSRLDDISFIAVLLGPGMDSIHAIRTETTSFILPAGCRPEAWRRVDPLVAMGPRNTPDMPAFAFNAKLRAGVASRSSVSGPDASTLCGHDAHAALRVFLAAPGTVICSLRWLSTTVISAAWGLIASSLGNAKAVPSAMTRRSARSSTVMPTVAEVADRAGIPVSLTVLVLKEAGMLNGASSGATSLLRDCSSAEAAAEQMLRWASTGYDREGADPGQVMQSPIKAPPCCQHSDHESALLEASEL